MTRKLRLGVVGCGDIAGYTALFSRLIPQVSLSACCDVNAERADAYAKRHRIRSVFTDFNGMLSEAPIDAVYLAVPHHLHYAMILGSIQAGKPVLAEKPLTRTLAEGTQLVEAIIQQDVKVGVNYQYRYDSGCYALARAVQSGEMGQVRSMRINVPWRRTQAYFEGAAWHGRVAQAGGGTLITQGSHFLDIALWALGEAPVSAVGYTARPGFDVEVDTLAHGIVETSGGTLVSITSTLAAAKEQAVTIEAYGERGTAIYSDRPLPHVKFTQGSVHRERPPVWGLHALHRSLAGFAKWILEDQPFLIPATSSLPVLAAVEAIYRSAEDGQKTRVHRFRPGQ